MDKWDTSGVRNAIEDATKKVSAVHNGITYTYDENVIYD